MKKNMPNLFEEPHSFRAFFAQRWSQFLHANYRNTEEVAYVFGVRHQTAVNWWHGDNKPSGDVVAMAFMRHGDEINQFMVGQE